MRALVTGSRGLLGAAIVRHFHETWEVLALDRSTLDVRDPDTVARTIAGARPDAVINCTAYTDVDGAETDAVTALDVNALAVRSVARAAAAAGAAFVHYSTDFVFDGETTEPYREEDRPNPRGVYAASKLLGEWLALEHPRAYVLRVESLFGEPGPGTSRQGSIGTIVKRIRAGEPVPVFVDRTVSPTYTTDIARATADLLAGRLPAGLYHCVNSGAASWSDVAAEAARLLDLPIEMTPITLESVKLKARRPRFCALSNAKLAAAGVAMPAWQDALARHLARMP